MGWTETYYHGRLSHKERRQEMDKLLTWESSANSYSVLRSTIKNNVYYAAVRQVEKSTNNVEVLAAIGLLSERKEGFGYWYGYKDMDETCGPFNYDCPVAILDLLTPTDNEYALKWRKKCRENAKKPRLSALKEGTRIKFVCPFDTTYHKAGEQIELTKCVATRSWTASGYGSRTTYRWLESNGRIYWKQTMIPDNFEVA